MKLLPIKALFVAITASLSSVLVANSYCNHRIDNAARRVIDTDGDSVLSPGEKQNAMKFATKEMTALEPYPKLFQWYEGALYRSIIELSKKGEE